MNTKTFELGIIQGRAYRQLERHLSRILAKHDLFLTDWKLLGQIYLGNDIQPAHLAKLLAVKRPFITAVLKKLEQKKLVSRSSNKEDKRYQQIQITPDGKKLIEVLEKEVKDVLKKLLKGANLIEIMTYGKVLKTIVKNGEEMEKTNAM